MSRRKLRRILCCVTLILIAYGVGYIVAAVALPEEVTEVMKALVPVVVAIPAAWLAGSFSRRSSYLQGMRDLWRHLIPAAQTAIQYTHLDRPSQRDLASVQKTLATAIDMLRGVFANVPIGDAIGLYPFENLKDISRIISWLGCGEEFREDQTSAARKCITRLWQETHEAMLAEFDRDVPTRPIGKYLNDGKRSVADLLFDGSLKKTDLDLGRRASQPMPR